MCTTVLSSQTRLAPSTSGKSWASIATAQDPRAGIGKYATRRESGLNRAASVTSP